MAAFLESDCIGRTTCVRAPRLQKETTVTPSTHCIIPRIRRQRCCSPRSACHPTTTAPSGSPRRSRCRRPPASSTRTSDGTHIRWAFQAGAGRPGYDLDAGPLLRERVLAAVAPLRSAGWQLAGTLSEATRWDVESGVGGDRYEGAWVRLRR